MKTIFLCENEQRFKKVYNDSAVAELIKIAGSDGHVYTEEDLRKVPDKFSNVEYAFSTWGMPVLDAELIKEALPSLKCLFYAAGSVQGFARPFMQNGIKVFSAWAANAVPVAEYTVAQILLANKGFFGSSRLMSNGRIDEARRAFVNYKGNYGERIGIIGVGMIGKLVIKMLKAYKLEILVFDAFLSDDEAESLGVRKCSLEEIFESCSVISNHLANNEATKGMLEYDLFSRMKPYATFLNTGRGAQVVERDLIKVLEKREDLTAILDVTDPEPPIESSPLFTLDNCILTPHIAGSSGDEVCRMAEYMIEEYKKYVACEPCCYEVTAKMLETMA